VCSYDFAELIRLSQDYGCNPRHIGSVKDLYSNYPPIISVGGQQLDTRSFTDLVKRIEAFPATECACEMLFYQLRNLIAISGPNVGLYDCRSVNDQNKNHVARRCADQRVRRDPSEAQLDTGPDQTAT
jgi:hypothetical protein